MSAAGRRFQKKWYASSHSGHRVRHAAVDKNVPPRTNEELRVTLGLLLTKPEEPPANGKPVFSIPRELMRYIRGNQMPNYLQ